MHKVRRRFGLCWILMTAILVACGTTYLSEPPSEFDDYIRSIPTPFASTQLDDIVSRWTSPREICTGFGYWRLYGTDETYPTILSRLERDLGRTVSGYVRMGGEIDPTYVLSDVETVGMSHVTVDDPVALMQFDEEILAVGQESFKTLFILVAEHRYGNCAAHPWWTQGEGDAGTNLETRDSD